MSAPHYSDDSVRLYLDLSLRTRLRQPGLDLEGLTA